MSTIGAKFGVGGSLTIGEDNAGISLGYGIGGTMKNGNQTQVLSSISITTKEKDEKTHALGVWSVENISPLRDENDKIVGYIGDLVERNLKNPFAPKVNNTGIKVTSDAITTIKTDGDQKVIETKPVNNWKSNDYKSEEEKKG